MTADFDGDGRSEIAVYRPSTGQWLAIDPITTAFVVSLPFGLGGDIPAPHDFDGDGRAIWPSSVRPSVSGSSGDRRRGPC